MKKILIVEDDIFFQKFYKTKLTEAGYEVSSASNGEDGINMAKVVNPDLILLDIIMPVKDGFEVLRTLKPDPSLVNTKIIVFSTLGQEQDIKIALSLGAIDYVNKTFFDFDTLLGKIKSHIGQ